MALLEDRPQLDLYDKEWLIHTRSEERAPGKIGTMAQVHRSLISHGCQVEGMVVNSVLSPGVFVGVGAVVRDSIVMFDTVIRPGAVIDRAILDKEVTVGPGAIVGEGGDLTVPNRLNPSHLTTGITIVGKRAVIPRGVRIGRNVRIDPDVRATDFPGRLVESGATITRGDGRPRARGRAAATARSEVPAARTPDTEAGPPAGGARRGEG